MTKFRLAVIALTIVTSLVIVSGAGATSQQSYALGKATSCRVDYVKATLTHKVKGKERRYVACVYKAPVVTTTTTKPGDPPTAVAIIASESPAIVGDDITYSMTVADVLTPTTGAIYMTDNGVTLTNCVGPTPTNQGSLSYSCDVTYTDGDVGDHLITGVFLGDQTYGQSAGTLDETVQEQGLTATLPPTGPTQTVTTTTTQPPAPLATVIIDVDNAALDSISDTGVPADETMTFGFNVTYTPSINSDPGNNTLYVDGVIPPACPLPPQEDNNTETCVLSLTSDPTLGGNATVQIDFVPGTYTITDTHGAEGIYPSSQAQAIIVDAS